MSKATPLSPVEHEDAIWRHLKVGDTITHVRRMGEIEEHLYTGRRGRLICGKPTRDTIRLGFGSFGVSDIAPASVTHINRMPVSRLDQMAESLGRSNEAQTNTYTVQYSQQGNRCT